jgi:hypothetical protein
MELSDLRYRRRHVVDDLARIDAELAELEGV